MLKKVILLLLLVIVISGCLFYHYGEKNRWKKGEAILALEQVTPQAINKPQYGKGIIRFSPNSKYLAVASEGGRVRIIEIKNQHLFYERKMGIGYVKCLTFSPDSKYLFLGEESPDGSLYCFSLEKKKLIWQYKTGDDLKANLSKKSYPSVNRIILDEKRGRVYFSAGRWEKVGVQAYSHQGKIYACSAKDGEKIWQFPNQGQMPANCKYIDMDPKGEKLVFATSGETSGGERKPYSTGTVACLQVKDGQAVWQKEIPPLKPFFQATNFSQSPNFSADGRYIALITNDGRAYLLNNEGKTIWEKEISTPKKELKGICFYAPGTWADFVGQQVIFRTGNTYDAWQKRDDLPVEYPNGNSLFAYSLQGNLLWKWQAKGYMPPMEVKDSYLAVPVEKNFRTQDLSVQGAYLLKISKGEEKKINLLEAYHPDTQGGIISADFSSNHRYIAALEVPLLLENNSLIGKSQLHIWQRKE